MNLFLIGIDYRSAFISVREDVYRKRRHIADFWSGHPSQHVAILTTCNRMELYGAGKDIINSKAYVGLFYKDFRQFFDYGYAAYDRTDIFRHSLCLACGLESQLKGEGQISRQLDAWRRHDSFPLPLAEFWGRVMTLSRDIRRRAGLDRLNCNIANIICEDLLKHTGPSRPLEIVIIGTGKIAELFTTTISPLACLSFVANKNRLRAEELAGQSGGRAFSFNELPEVLINADAVISATSSPHFVLGTDDFYEIAARRNRLLYIYDIAMPRDIEPAVSRIEGVILKNLDDLTGLFNENNECLRHKFDLAERLVEKALKEHEGISYGQDPEGWDAIQPVSAKAS